MNFAEPWEAQAYALAVKLSERGLLDLSEWTSAGGSLEALERAVGELAGPETLAAHRAAWARAAARTPHGRPIELTDADFR